jgi:hypothetical protein
VNHDIRVGGDDLLLRRELGALLELEITNCPGKRKVAVDTTEIDESSSSYYPRLFTWAAVSTATG